MELLGRRIYNRAEALATSVLIRGFSGKLQVFVVNEYPRSGGTWIGQMLGEALGVPFQRNRIPAFRSSVLHVHYLRPFGMRNVVAVFRDGRDVMVSYYFYHFFYLPQNHLYVSHVAPRLDVKDPNDVERYLPRFIEFMLATPRQPHFAWHEFAARWWRRPGVICVRYEETRSNAAAIIKKIVRGLTGRLVGDEEVRAIASRYSFERQTGRRPGQELRRAFARRGIVGEWKKYFNAEAREIFSYYAGRELIRLGYETDDSWVRVSGLVNDHHAEKVARASG